MRDARRRGRRHQVQPHRRRHRGRPGLRGADPRAAARRPARRRVPRRGGRRRRRAPPGSAGSSTRSTAPSTTSTACRTTPSRSRPRAATRSWPGWCSAPSLGPGVRRHARRGATRNGVPLQVAAHARRSSRPWSATGFGYETDGPGPPGPGRWPGCCPQVRDIRRLGSCALDLCAVAAGQLDAYVEEGPHVWDYAAGGLVAAEAGATLEVWTRSSGTDLVVCAPTPGWPDFPALVAPAASSATARRDRRSPVDRVPGREQPRRRRAFTSGLPAQ